MVSHLLPRRTRAAMGVDMSTWDWCHHYFYMLTDGRYRDTFRALKTATRVPTHFSTGNGNALRDATRHLRRQS